VASFLLDTNVVSELVKPAPDAGVLKFLAREGDLWLSVITLHELAFGIARLGESGRVQRLTTWLGSLRTRFGSRILPVDQMIAEAAGSGRGRAASQGRVVAPLDALIAATAQMRSLTLATRNIRDFEALDVPVIDPWSA
jgi:predicted nucleic acid-binding protein